MVDYRKILLYYLDVVGVCEGTDFVGNGMYKKIPLNCPLTQEEWDALMAASKEVCELELKRIKEKEL